MISIYHTAGPRKHDNAFVNLGCFWVDSQDGRGNGESEHG